MITVVLALGISLSGFGLPFPQVIDGDTLRGEPNIRIWGIDAPEKGEPGGTEATAYLSKLLTDESLTCEEKGTDRFGRIVAQCFLDDGRDIACELVKAGHARDWPKYSKGHYARCQ